MVSFLPFFVLPVKEKGRIEFISMPLYALAVGVMLCVVGVAVVRCAVRLTAYRRR